MHNIRIFRIEACHLQAQNDVRAFPEVNCISIMFKHFIVDSMHTHDPVNPITGLPVDTVTVLVR